MQCFTIQKFPVIQPGIRVECVPDLAGDPQWVARVGREDNNSLLTQFPVPSNGHIVPDNAVSNWATFKYLDNNVARYLVLIRDQSPSKGVSRIDFTNAQTPLCAGYVGKGPGGKFGGGFEYIAFMALGQHIDFTIIRKGQNTPTYYTLASTGDGLRFFHGISKKKNHQCPSSVINLGSNGTPLWQK